MSAGAVAERYAQAIFELGVETGQLATITEQFRKVAEVYEESHELRTALDNPVLEEGARLQILEEVATRVGATGIALNALKVMVRRRRTNALPEVAEQLTKLSDDQQGLVRASVTSAVPLSEAYLSQLKEKLERATQRRVILEERQDPSLIGGVITKLGDNILDSSVAGRLAALERKLLLGASSQQA